MSKAKTIACANCVFFERRLSESGNEGECRVNPPTFASAGFITGYWPVIKSYNWCGEYSDGKLPWDAEPEKPA